MRICCFNFVEYFENWWIESFGDGVVGSRDGAVKIGKGSLVARSLLFGFPRLLFHRRVVGLGYVFEAFSGIWR